MKLCKWIAATFVIFALISAIAGILLCDMALHPGRKPLTETSQAAAEALADRYGAVLENATLEQPDGIRCKAWYFRSALPSPGVVVVLHGLSDNRSGMAGYIELFLSNGYSVLAPDSRAHGASEGRVATYGLLERQDLVNWLQWLRRKQPETPIYGLGESMGAAILLQSLQAGAPFRAVVAEASFSNFTEIGCDRMSQNLHVPFAAGRLLFRPAVEAGFVRGKQRYGLNLRDVAPERACRESPAPVLLIHSERDTNIPFRHALRIREICGSQIEYWFLPDGSHASTISKHRAEFARRVLQLFDSSAWSRN